MSLNKIVEDDDCQINNNYIDFAKKIEETVGPFNIYLLIIMGIAKARIENLEGSAIDSDKLCFESLKHIIELGDMSNSDEHFLIIDKIIKSFKGEEFLENTEDSY